MQREKSILVVDDDPAVLSGVALVLEQAGYAVTTCADGAAAHAVLHQGPQPQLVVLDVMLPDTDGYALCRLIRQKLDYIPILMLSAKDEASAKVQALDLGADDYVIKPFVPAELLARIRAIFRLAYQQVHPDQTLTYYELALGLDTGVVTVNNLRLELSAIEYDLLSVLMHKPEQVFGREMLLREVWGMEFLGNSRMVDVCVQRLRGKLEALTSTRYIQTVHGLGYCLRRDL